MQERASSLDGYKKRASSLEHASIFLGDSTGYVVLLFVSILLSAFPIPNEKEAFLPLHPILGDNCAPSSPSLPGTPLSVILNSSLETHE